MTIEQRDEQIIDVWGYVKKIWIYKWVWLLIFVVVVALGFVYSSTRPDLTRITQSALIVVPEVSSEYEATQQQSTFNSISNVLQRLATRPPVSDVILSKHPDIEDIAELDSLITVSGSGLLIDIVAVGEDVEAMDGLVGDVAAAMEQEIPNALSGNLPHLQVSVQPLGEPVSLPLNSSSASVLATSVLLGLFLATATSALLVARRSRTA